METHRRFGCPCCGSTRIKKIWHTTKKDSSISVLWCRPCGFGWRHPYPSQHEIKHFYQKHNLYHSTLVNEHQGGFPKRIKIINQLKPEQGHLLDIGSGMGHFLHNARQTGWDVEGIEPREAAWSYCDNHFGIKVHNVLFEEWNNTRLYDVISMWDVVEHVCDPFDMIRKSVQMLSPEGLLVLSIPNASGLFATLFMGDWRYVMPSHVNYFTLSFIRKILSRMSLDIVRMDHSIKAQSIFEAILSLIPLEINPERIYPMTYRQSENSRSKNVHMSNNAMRSIRKRIFQFNELSWKLPVGDIVDIYCKPRRNTDIP